MLAGGGDGEEACGVSCEEVWRGGEAISVDPLVRPVHCEIKSLNKGYFRLRILSRPDIQDIYGNIF